MSPFVWGRVEVRGEAAARRLCPLTRGDVSPGDSPSCPSHSGASLCVHEFTSEKPSEQSSAHGEPHVSHDS